MHDATNAWLSLMFLPQLIGNSPGVSRDKGVLILPARYCNLSMFVECLQC